MPAVHLIIKGKVQGVFYRATAKKKAKELNITGWIKNNEDGDVEAVASGEESALQVFMNWCKQGPENAMVENVMIRKINNVNFDTFKINR